MSQPLGVIVLIVLELVIGLVYWVGVNILQAVIGIMAIMTIYSLYCPTVKKYFNRR